MWLGRLLDNFKRIWQILEVVLKQNIKYLNLILKFKKWESSDVFFFQGKVRVGLFFGI